MVFYMVISGMKSKWKIKGYQGFCFGEDRKLYRLPYENKKRYYGIRELKKQYPARYKINGKWVSERQLKDKIYLDPEPVELFKTKNLPL